MGEGGKNGVVRRAGRSDFSCPGLAEHLGRLVHPLAGTGVADLLAPRPLFPRSLPVTCASFRPMHHTGPGVVAPITAAVARRGLTSLHSEAQGPSLAGAP